MKNIIKLGMLAALANVSVHAVTANFGGSSTTSQYLNESGGSTITLSAWEYRPVSTTWRSFPDVTLGRDSLGVGIENGSGVSTAVEGTYQEYLLIDFGGTATGTVSLNSLTLNYPTNNPPTTQPAPPYFKYAWILGTPSGSTPAAGTAPWGVGGGSSGYFTLVQTGATPLSNDLYQFTNITGSGRYLMLGAINGTLNSTNYFQLNSLDYTSVPDGASTLALMGAAVATLGLAARRRKQ
jgi:hypothetical protein